MSITYKFLPIPIKMHTSKFHGVAGAGDINKKLYMS